MRVLVDTCVWIDFFNGRPNPAADALARLLDDEDDVLTCALIAAELLQGVRRDRRRATSSRLYPRRASTPIPA